MVTLDQIIKLVDAGYTAEQIRIMESAEPLPEPAKAEPTPEPAKAEPEKAADAGGELAAQVASLKELIKNSNIIASKQPAQISADEALANFFKPRG